MTEKFVLLAFAFFLHQNAIRGATIIDSGVRRSNTLDANECSTLISSNLIEEIQSYQPIVNKIVAKAINSEFSGSTWNRLVTSTLVRL